MRLSHRLAATLVFGFSVLAFAIDKATVAEVLKDPAKFDDKVVTVTGKVTKFKQKTSKAGNPYYNFKLVGKGEEELSVYGRGKAEPAPEDGQMVEVTGKFAKEKKVGSVTYKNEIDVTKNADDKKTADFGIKVIKGG